VRQRCVGIDVGAETLKLVELSLDGVALRLGRRLRLQHDKQPAELLRRLLDDWDWPGVRGAAVTGRLGRQVALPRVPTKQALAAGFRYWFGSDEATVVSIGGHGFSVLELRRSGLEVLRENSRCSQGTGNFLRQLVERFGLSIEAASELCADVDEAAALSGRCPVILKTDMTHLANKGEDRGRILAGLYDAVCENVQVLIKPRVSPSRLLLTGGVAHSRRIRAHFARFAARHGFELIEAPGDGFLFLEAVGAAVIAARGRGARPPLDALLADVDRGHLERVPPLAKALSQVQRMPRVPLAPAGAQRRLALGFDIGSTGSKLVAVDADGRDVVFEDYLNTSGDPVGAAQGLMQRFAASPASLAPVVVLGATGSGREIVGSLLATCYGVEVVHVLNEIAAHAEGALHFDRRVDTIFEIGGQDAKYVRLAGGRVVDAAMNEACSAGTGSFIEEQGRRFPGIRDVVQLGEDALAAEEGVSLGQHCSVFMAEVIDEAFAAGVDRSSVTAGIYDSIIQNYLNRVKGSRDVGQVVFCQGMPFASDALAAAVARRTGSRVIVPPNPGTVGALGIALLALKAVPPAARRDGGIELQRFLAARVQAKDSFVCRSTRGCGSGNRCRIDRLTTVVEGGRQRFTWGGGCSLYDRGVGKRKLPDRAPDPFRERAALLADVVQQTSGARGGERIAMTFEFALKELFPFFATYLHALGLDLAVAGDAGARELKRGIEAANVPFCAPMQQYHGQVAALAEAPAEWLFLPMLRSLPRSGSERLSVVCPIVQASADVLRRDLGREAATRVVSPVVDFGAQGLHSPEFRRSCRELARELGVRDWRTAFERGLAAQLRFDAARREVGRRALAFCREHDVVPVAVLGRSYTITNRVLNSNVPALLREQGAVAIPVDCLPLPDDVPVFDDIYWGYGQRNLRAAYHVRRTPGLYSLWCSNYSCGPDSFNLHFYATLMEGKPFAVIETDGHSGDAGTKTRVEAFLHCVREELASGAPSPEPRAGAAALASDDVGFGGLLGGDETVLFPRMGPGADAVAACLRGVGIAAEALPEPNRDALQLGRRHTSGKECVPMCITLGSVLQRLESEPDPSRHFAFFMPTADGPCRFGVYHLLHKLVLERSGLRDRVRIWSPSDTGYFDGLPGGVTALLFAGFMTADLLLEMLYHVRPVESQPGAAQRIYERAQREMIEQLEAAGRERLSLPAALLGVFTGGFFGCADLLRRTARAFAAVRGAAERPTVLVVGEIYVRCDPFANDHLIEKLEERGLRVRFAPFNEWLEYSDVLNRMREPQSAGDRLGTLVQDRIQAGLYAEVAAVLGWPPRTSVADTLRAGSSYVREALAGEAILTVGGPVHEWREGLVDGVVNAGPLECMPSKVAESQLFHAAEEEGLISLTVPYNGDPMDTDVLDNFAFEVRARFERKRALSRRQLPPPRLPLHRASLR